MLRIELKLIEFLDNQVRLNEQVDQLMKDFHKSEHRESVQLTCAELDGLVHYKDGVLQQKIARTGQYNQAVAECRQKTENLYEETQRFMGLGSKRRKVGV